MDEDRNLDILRAIERNTRAIAQILALSLPKGFTDRLGALLDSETKRLAYSLSDGSRSAREVGRLTGVAHTTIGRWWSDWITAGICDGSPENPARSTLDINLLTLAERLEGGLPKRRSKEVDA